MWYSGCYLYSTISLKRPFDFQLCNWLSILLYLVAFSRQNFRKCSNGAEGAKIAIKTFKTPLEGAQKSFLSFHLSTSDSLSCRTLRLFFLISYLTVAIGNALPLNFETYLLLEEISVWKNNPCKLKLRPRRIDSTDRKSLKVDFEVFEGLCIQARFKPGKLRSLKLDM